MGIALQPIVQYAMIYLGHPNPARVFLITAVLTLGATIYIVILLPDSLVRLVLWLATHSVYRIRVEGRDNIPETGGALFVANHMSFVDALLLIASTDRPIRFLIFKDIYDLPFVKPFAKLIRAIPDFLRASPARNAAVAAPGERRDPRRRSRLHFCRGPNHAHRPDASLPPRHGTHHEGRGRADRPGESRRRLGQHLQLRARAVPLENAAFDSLPGHHQFRQADAARRRRLSRCARPCSSCKPRRIVHHKSRMRTLHRSLIRTAHRQPFRFAMGDKRRPRMKWGGVLLSAIFLARRLRPAWAGQEMVGILLPPSVPGALVNFAAMLAGKVPVNLNYTTSSETLASCARSASWKP